MNTHADPCECCAENDHEDCINPVSYRGHHRGDNFAVTICCCQREAEEAC